MTNLKKDNKDIYFYKFGLIEATSKDFIKHRQVTYTFTIDVSKVLDNEKYNAMIRKTRSTL